MKGCKKPVICVEDLDGNAFGILGKVSKILRKEVSSEVAESYIKEASSGDYDHLLQVTGEYVNIE